MKLPFSINFESWKGRDKKSVGLTVENLRGTSSQVEFNIQASLWNEGMVDFSFGKTKRTVVEDLSTRPDIQARLATKLSDRQDVGVPGFANLATIDGLDLSKSNIGFNVVSDVKSGIIEDTFNSTTFRISRR